MGKSAIVFVCVDCERELTVIGHLGSEAPDLCAACMCHPGWYTDPDLASIIDPQNLRGAADFQPPVVSRMRRRARAAH